MLEPAGDAAEPVYCHAINGPCRCGTTHGHAFVASTGGSFSLESAIAVYDYHDELGSLRYKVARFLPKTFRQFHDAGGDVWKAGLNGEKKLLFRMREVMVYDPSKTVLLVEGEKDVNTAWEIGFPATCNSGGSQGWSGDVVELARRVLKGRSLVVVADNDEQGQGDKWAEAISKSMRGHAAAVYVVHMPAPYKDLTEAVQGGEDIRALLKAAVVEEKDAAAEALRTRPTRVSTAQIFEPIPPTVWTVEGLQICPGRPTMLMGFGFSGKSLFAQSTALYVASGQRAFGRWSVSIGRVLHIDFDQGLKATKKRYQRLARGLSIRPEDIGDRLEIETHPPDLRLLEPGSESILERVVDGFSLVIVDALKGFTAGIDENESGIREYIDKLTPMSERTGASFLILHHEGKGDPEDGRMSGRGSSAIYDSAGAMFRLKGDKTDKSGPKRLIQTKSSAEAEGPGADDLMVHIIDVEDVRGVRVELRDAEPGSEDAYSPDGSKDAIAEKRVLETVRANPIKLRSSGELVSMTGGRRELVLKAIKRLETAGQLRKDSYGFYEVGN